MFGVRREQGGVPALAGVVREVVDEGQSGCAAAIAAAGDGRRGCGMQARPPAVLMLVDGSRAPQCGGERPGFQAV